MRARVSRWTVTSQRFDPDPSGRQPAFQRDLTTFACYFLLALLTLFMAMIGPLIPALMTDLKLDFTQASLHSVAQAAGMAVTGAIGERLALRLGRTVCVRLSLALMSAGIVLLCLATHPAMSLGGAFAIGCGASLILMAANSAMAERHGSQAGVAFSEANVIAYLGIIAAPGVVSLLTVYGHWRWTFLASVGAAAAFAFIFRTAEFGAPRVAARAEARAPLGFAYWCFWGLLMTSVSAENIFLIWTAAYFETEAGWARPSALLASMAFPAGILMARMLGVALVRRFPVRQLVLPVIFVGVAGFLLFRFGESPAAVLIGLAIAGFGMGNLYPFGITLAMAAAGGDRDTATARISLASAASMISAPLIVGTIADHIDLAAAFGVIPVYLAMASVAFALGIRRLGES